MTVLDTGYGVFILVHSSRSMEIQFTGDGCKGRSPCTMENEYKEIEDMIQELKDLDTLVQRAIGHIEERLD